MSYENIPSSPALPTLQHPVVSRRKRSLSPCALDVNTSSDPPVFSSDPPEPSVDNYISVKKKRRYKGPWWSNQTNASHGPRNKSKPLTRNIDSGVWLPSDTSDFPSSDVFTPEILVEGVVANDAEISVNLKTRRTGGIGAGNPISLEELDAQSKIQQCLELGEERIDLCGLSLESLSDETLRPLHSLIRPPRVDGSTRAPEDYKPFIPSIQLFLSRNALKTVPTEIWQLQNLTVLSLRNNNLECLPPSISKLHNLVELNVANNRLRWLPWELLQLVGRNGRLRRLAVLPNPLFQGIQFHGRVAANRQWRFPPVFDELDIAAKRLKEKVETVVEPDKREQLAWLLKLHEVFKKRIENVDLAREVSPDGEDRLGPKESMAWKTEPVFVATTPVSYFRFDGTPESHTALPPSSWPEGNQYLPANALATSDSKHDRKPIASRVPSLLELSVRECSQHLYGQFTSLLPPDTPEPILRVLKLAEEVKQCGGLECSVCGKDYVIRRTEWVEYWHYVPDTLTCSTEELFLPFLRAGCSWGCAETSRERDVIGQRGESSE